MFNFYVYLRTHPLLIRQQIAASAQDFKRSPALLLSGFSGSEQNNEVPEKQVLNYIRFMKIWFVIHIIIFYFSMSNISVII